MIERFFSVPLDHAKPEGEKIRIFARHIIPKDKAKTPEEEEKLPFRECQSTEATSEIVDTGEQSCTCKVCSFIIMSLTFTNLLISSTI